MNLARVLAAVLAADSPPTRADVAGLTATTRATASRLVDELVGGDVLDEVAVERPRRPGRPGTPLVAGHRIAALGLQVDVDRMTAVVVDLAGTVRARRTLTADHRGSEPGPVLDRLGGLAREALADAGDLTVVGSGVALPGIVADGGVLLRAPNLGWSDVPVAALLPTLPGSAPPTVGNEADLAAVTVSFTAPGRPGRYGDFVYVSGSTGIGGSLVLDGHALRGRHGWAGEVGHVTVDADGPPCACGSTGCLELYAGARALALAAGLDPDARTGAVAERARSGEPAAVAAVEQAARAIGIALAAVVNVIDVPVIVLGGHLREIGDLLRPTLESTLRERVLSAGWVTPEVRLADEQPAAAAHGAAVVELHRLVGDPARWLADTLAPRPLPEAR